MDLYFTYLRQINVMVLVYDKNNAAKPKLINNLFRKVDRYY